MNVHRALAILPVVCGILLSGAGLADTEREPSAEQDDDRISLSFTGVSIQEAIALFAQATGVDIIDASGGHDRQKGWVSANIVDKPWRVALETVLEQCDLKLVERPADSGIYVVLPGDSVKEDQEAHAALGLSDMLAGFGFVVILSVLGFVVNLLFGVAVWVDGVRLRREGRRAYLLPPVLWALGVLGSGLLGVGIYWVIHHSSLKRQDKTANGRE